MSDQKMSHRRRVRVAGSLGVIALVVSLSAAACSSNSGSSQGAVNNSNNVAQTEYSEFTAAVPYPFAKTAPSDALERKNLAARLV